MSTFHDVIEAFREAPTNSERGTKFEKLMVRYFELDPLWSNRFDGVWRWMDWPDRPHNRPDNGIDLVAREADTGALVAIQCKFYSPATRLGKEHLDSFFTESGKHGFSERLIISTTDRWGKNAKEAIRDQQIPVQRIDSSELAGANIDWDIAWPQGELQVDLTPSKPHELRPHQKEALDAVFARFDEDIDRGQLIMACGTGKTFTSLKIAEEFARRGGGRARVLFAVPSISLLSQTLREWTAQTALDLRAFAVCSDNKVSRAAEDYNVEDIPIPVTTKPDRLRAELEHRKRAAGLTVVFTTYQSLPVVAEAQKLGADPFDIVLCDEAHRTTGVTLEGEDESNFVRVHDADYLKASKRLYMTATPRLFDQKVRDKAEQASAEIASMDDPEVFGPELHRLSFGQAVERGLLTDYKVLVLSVDESVIAPKMQGELASEGELSLDDASKIIGCWNGLAKRAGTDVDGGGFQPGEPPMRRAVAFARDIKTSRRIEELLPVVVDSYRELLDETDAETGAEPGPNRDLSVAIHHVDGTFNAMERNAELTWLKSAMGEDEARILINARCLSEGVDVPALDAVMFLHPRNSQVDVVQSVGRVMRKSPGKNYGYIILPIAVPADTPPSVALEDNRRFRTVWQVLNALRAHDERFNAMVNAIALNAGKDKQKTGRGSALLADHVGPSTADAGGSESIGTGDSSGAGDGPASGGGDPRDPGEAAEQIALFSLAEWQEAIYTRIVDKVGTRTYWEDWAADVADISQRQILRINAILAEAQTKSSPTIRRFERFLKGLRDNLNDGISRDDAISMLSQHLITKPVFDALFAGHDFASHNPVSRVMQSMVDALDGAGLEAETSSLERFYDSVRVRAEEVTSAEGKQQVIAELYERFFKIGFAKQASALGIVYTPVEIVDFIVRAANDVLRETFGKTLSDADVHILDGFTGTGTFIVRVLQSGLIRPEDLARKYAEELHANEIMLLAYYIAAVNIEATYHALAGKSADDEYEPFPGIVMADTFQIYEDGDELDLSVFPANNERITRQLEAPINVIIGNPPYSVGQTSANDLNANLRYPGLDARIEDTYARRSTATNKNSLYDSYLRAFRWATDRIGDRGVVAFVSNGGWIDGNTADGIRLSLGDEYSRIYVYNLRGNQRTAGELSRKEGGKVFGGGSRNTIAIWIGVKNPAHVGPCKVHYHDIGDYLSREQKLARVDVASVASLAWESITPNSHGDWVNQRDDAFASWPVLGAKSGESSTMIFGTFSRGLETSRDNWVYGYARPKLELTVRMLIDNFNSARAEFADWSSSLNIAKPRESDVTKFLSLSPLHADPTRIKWSRSLRTFAARGVRLEYQSGEIVDAGYRPFEKRLAYFNRHLNHERGQLPSLFPTPAHDNIGIVVTGAASHFEFTPFMTNLVPNLHTLDTAQFFPRWTWEAVAPDDGGLDLFAGGGCPSSAPGVEGEILDGYRRVDNITDAILAEYREKVAPDVTKDDIFYFVYGQLHEPAYRERYAADLKKVLPHIETPTDEKYFRTLASAGRRLSALHVGYEDVDPWPLDVEVSKKADPTDRDTWRVQKMKWAAKDDHTAVLYNPKVRIVGIPAEAEEYMLGSRTALGWIIDRYQVKTDRASGIVNDPNDWADEHDDPKYIVDLIAKVTRVAVETVDIVRELEGAQK